MADIANNIKRNRLSSGMNQAQLAEKIGVTRQTISSWERGASFPDIKMLEELSSVFDIRIDELLYPLSREKRKHIAEKPFTFIFFFLSIIIYSVLLIWGGGIAVPVLKKIVGGGIAEEFIIVIYWGLILLVGYFAVCMRLFSEYISNHRDNDDSNNSENKK